MEIPAALYALLGAVLVLQLWTLYKLSGLARRVATPRVQSAPRDEPAPGHSEDAASEDRGGAEQGRLFAEFLNEDPARMELAKKEQFEAFRRWRAERGLNWRGR